MTELVQKSVPRSLVSCLRPLSAALTKPIYYHQCLSTGLVIMGSVVSYGLALTITLDIMLSISGHTVANPHRPSVPLIGLQRTRLSFTIGSARRTFVPSRGPVRRLAR